MEIVIKQKRKGIDYKAWMRMKRKPIQKMKEEY